VRVDINKRQRSPLSVILIMPLFRPSLVIEEGGSPFMIRRIDRPHLAGKSTTAHFNINRRLSRAVRQAVIVDCVRTPVGRSHERRGNFRNIRGDELGVRTIRALLDRTGIDPAEVEDVVFGAVQHHGEQGVNVARIIGALAGLPIDTAGATINRLCGSGLQAINQVTHSIMAGFEDVHITGGVEHMEHVGMESEFDVHPRWIELKSRESLSMGLSAEHTARTFGISRRAQDEFALRSHRLAAKAQAAGQFDKEIVPIHTTGRKGKPVVIDKDQCIRPDTTLEQMAEMQAAFLPGGGTVTAANSSPLSDGAAALLMMSDEKARSLGAKPLARVVATTVVGVEPRLFGTGPIPATKKLLDKVGMTLDDVDVVELNEAFSSQALACLQQLDLSEEKVNVRGGSIAIGHPLGASGARITTTLIHNMIDRDATFGLAAMCVGLGQGIATIFERLN